MTLSEAFEIATQLHRSGRLAEAEAIYRQVLAVDPDDFNALHLSGVVSHQLGKNYRAIELISKAVEIYPSEPIAYNNLGEAYRALNLLEKAETCYRQALLLMPDFDAAHCNLGDVLKALDRQDEAEHAYRQALSIKPDYSAAHFKLGILLHQHDRPVEAEASYLQALLLDPCNADIFLNLGNVLRMQGKTEEAVASFRKAVLLKPEDSDARDGLLFYMTYVSDLGCAEIHAEHMRYGEIFEEPLRAKWQKHGNSLEQDRRLRIGYVSGDFRRHAVAFFLEPVLMRHNHERFEIFCYYTFSQEDAFTSHLRGCADVWRSVADLDDDGMSRLIREDGIDILVDLSGHTSHNRLLVFARKPAPVQVSWLGTPTTTGLRSIDYRIVDNYTDPVGMSEQYHSETLWRLPDCSTAYQPPPEAPPVRALPALANGFVTFGSFNNFNKVTPQVMALWSKVLKAVPGSRLLLKTAGLEKENQRLSVKNSFAACGIDEARLVLRGRDMNFQQHLDHYGEVDIALDSFPYNSATTACEGLWMGVPVITLAGDRFTSRMCMSIACNTGLAEWVAQTPEEYIGLALKWSQDLPRLAALRAGLRVQLSGSPFFDTERFTRNLEAAYHGMWRSYVEKAEC